VPAGSQVTRLQVSFSKPKLSLSNFKIYYINFLFLKNSLSKWSIKSENLKNILSN